LKILIHICCAPCAIFPLKFLRNEGVHVKGFFYRHNIHPYTECLKREETLQAYAQDTNLDVIYQKGYELEGFLQNVVFRESQRCQYCYHERLKSTAYVAKQGRFDCFTTTLLYSKFQKHELIKSIGNSVAKVVGIPFYYQDFRIGWKEGVDESKRIGMYRQQYCGCIFSEKERYFIKPSSRE
jgi:predicted adenine nucleotide alpha hydrolase (AANH) superfamily ATPase